MSLQRHNDFGLPMIRTVTIADSVTVAVGDAVSTIATGVATRVTAGTSISGVVVDIVDIAGRSVFGSIASLGGATVTGQPGSGSVTTGASNDDVDFIAVRIDISPFTIYSIDLTGTIGTTANSDLEGGWFDLDDHDSATETSFTRTAGTVEATMNGHGTDPKDTSRILGSIHESTYWNKSGDIS